jgi:23S rRNA pseudouridine2605 synthase
MRLNRYLALCGVGSRRSVDKLVSEGRVKVNGEKATLGLDVGEKDAVEVDGKSVRPREEHAYFMLNKPAGILCSRSDPGGRTTVYHLLPKEIRALHYVGRLDKDSRGLLFFTSDGDLTQSLTHPSHGVLRVYAVRTAQRLSQEEIRQLKQGVEVEPGVIFKCAVVKELTDGYELSLREGKKREIRRLLAALGHSVVDLQRIAFGGVELGELPEGACRPLSQIELEALRRASALDAMSVAPARGDARNRKSDSRRSEFT